MAVFRIERTKDYTVMSNHHLRNHELSLKAKGLLSMMLSLPDDWNYTTRGLAKICKEGTDSIGSALKELERAGYIVRNRLRDSKGKIVAIHEVGWDSPLATPTHIIMMFSAGCGTAYEGTVGQTLYVDNVAFIYD